MALSTDSASASEHPECDPLPRRLRQICRGEVLTPEECDAYRVLWGLGRLSADSPQKLSSNSFLETYRRSQSTTVKAIPGGPGRKLRELFAELQIPYREDCNCNAYARQMDEWGVDGCRIHFEEITKHLRDNAVKYSLWSYFTVAARTIATGIFFQLNPLDPFPGLVTEAIGRAELEVKAVE